MNMVGLKLLIFPICICAIEVRADDTKAIDAVLKADKKRLALLEECQQLEKAKGKEANTDRLKEVSIATLLRVDASFCESMLDMNIVL